MIIKNGSNVSRLRRHKRVRKVISGSAQRPRLCVYRSLSNIYAQLIDDVAGTTLVAASTLENKDVKGGNKQAAREVGKLIAQKALDKGIEQVVFDRGGYIYHGRVAELAEGAREGGLKF